MRHTMLLLLTTALLAGCAGGRQAAPPASQPSSAATAPTAGPTEAPATTPAPAAPGATDAEAVLAAIQATVDDYARAYGENDIELLRTTVDQTNAPIRRLVEERFETYQASVLSGGAPELTVTDVKQRDLGFVQAPDRQFHRRALRLAHARGGRALGDW
jgi:ABC-type phosphate transport system substrate-binding protein